MKKYSWILALLVALAMVFVGCGEGNGPDGPGGPPDFVSNLGAFSIVMEANAHEDEGFHFSSFNGANLMKGNRVFTGDVFTLDIEFTVSRDIDDDLLIYLVDNTEAVGWWGQLSCTGDDDADRIEASELKAGETISATITMTAVATASSAAAAANKLCFETKNEDQTLPAITINFTKFVFGRGDISDAGEPPPPPVVFDPPAAIAPPAGSVKLGDFSIEKDKTLAGAGPNQEYQIKWELSAATRTAIIANDLEKLYVYVDLDDVTGGFGGWQIIFQSNSVSWSAGEVNAPWGGWLGKSNLETSPAIDIEDGIVRIVIDLSGPIAGFQASDGYANIFIQTQAAPADIHNGEVLIKVLGAYLAP